MYFVARHFGSLPIVSRLVLKDGVVDDDGDEMGDELLAAAEPPLATPMRVGMTGTALTPLRPVGRVEFGDRIVDVVAAGGYIPAGARVRIYKVSEFSIDVEPVGEQDAPPRFGEGQA
jgi:membrane-bound serine protease (ClpP class)